MERAKYVVAGFNSFTRIINHFFKDESHEEYFNKDDLSQFFSNTCYGFLRSFGSNFKQDKKKFHNYKFREAETCKKYKNTGYFDKSKLYMDSGGYQISSGLLSLDRSELLMKLYYEFLDEYSDVYDKSFILDIPPGINCDIIKSEKHLYEMNFESYSKGVELKDHIRKKMIYIHHFRSPILYKTYNKLLRENNFFEKFDYFGTGGIVNNSNSDMRTPCILYIFPLIILLNECKKYNRKKLNFHILGGANYRDMLFYELISKHVYKIHNIELNISFDSSGLFKSLMRARVMYLYDGEIFHKTDLRSHLINLRYKDNIKVIDLLTNEIELFSKRHSYIKDYRPKEIYIKNKDGTYGTFNEVSRIYMLLYMLDQYSLIQTIVSNVVNDYLYDYYKNENESDFLIKVFELVKTFNGGRLTKKHKIKSASIKNSLDLLTDLDESKCEHLIKTYLSKDEFNNLDKKTQILKI
jgi:hypothetical protein